MTSFEFPPEISVLTAQIAKEHERTKPTLPSSSVSTPDQTSAETAKAVLAKIKELQHKTSAQRALSERGRIRTQDITPIATAKIPGANGNSTVQVTATSNTYVPPSTQISSDGSTNYNHLHQ